MKKIALYILCLGCLSCIAVTAQTLVPQYGVKTAGTPYLRLAADQKGFTYVYGAFDHFEGKNYGRLLKLDATGKPVSGFPIIYLDRPITRLVIQPDNKVLIGGGFTTMNGTSVKSLVRLNEDGTKDNTFESALTGTGGFALQSTGKIIVVSDSKFKRLNVNGSLDNSFLFQNFTAGYTEFVIGPGDEIYYFSTPKVFKATKDGADDNTFRFGTLATAVIQVQLWELAIQPDGKLLVGGQFETYDGFTSGSIIRLNTNGTADQTFAVGKGANGGVYQMAVRKNGNVVFGGQFQQYNGTAGNLIEVSASGSLVKNIATISTNNIESIQQTTDSKIMIGGEFQTVNNQAVPYFARFDASNALEQTFNPKVTYSNPNNVRTEASNGSSLIRGTYETQGILSNGKLITGKNFFLNGLGAYNLTIKNTDFFGLATTLFQSDGKLLAVVTSTGVKRIIRYLPDGTEDLSFLAPDLFTKAGAKTIPACLFEYNDLLLVGGTFDAYGNNSSAGLVALNKDGTFSKAFALPSGSSVSFITKQNSGKLILSGSFPFTQGSKNIIRLNADYSIDPSFNQSAYYAYTMSVDENDRIYFIGNNTINGTYYAVGRLRADGTFDNAFAASQKFEVGPNLHAVKALPGGLVAIGGYFDEFNNEAHSGLVLVNESGNYVDMPFGFGLSSAAPSLHYSNGALYAAGRFVKKDYTDVTSVIKINFQQITAPAAPINLSAALTSSGQFNITWTDQSSNELAFVLERSEPDKDFIALDTLDSNVISFIDLKAENNKKYSYRVRAVNDAGFSAYSNVADLIKVVTAIEDHATDIVTVYPNPVANTLYVKADGSLGSLAIVSMNGLVIPVTRSDMDDVSAIDLSHLPSGLYILQYSTQGRLERKKFLKM